MASIPQGWLLLFLAVIGVGIAVALTMRMRKLAAAKRVAAEEERERMVDRLALVEEAEPLTPPAAMQTRPEERWTRRRFPARRSRT